MTTEVIDDTDDEFMFEPVEDHRHPRFYDAIAERVYAVYLLMSGMENTLNEEYRQATIDLVGVVIRSIPANSPATFTKIK
jgi:hypothetical protein